MSESPILSDSNRTEGVRNDLVPFAAHKHLDVVSLVVPIVNGMLVSQVGGSRDESGHLLPNKDPRAIGEDFLGDLQTALNTATAGQESTIQISGKRLEALQEQFEEYAYKRQLTEDEREDQGNTLKLLQHYLPGGDPKGVISRTKQESGVISIKESRNRNPEEWKVRQMPASKQFLDFISPLLTLEKKEFYKANNMAPHMPPVDRYGERIVAADLLDRLANMPVELRGVIFPISLHEAKHLRNLIASKPDYEGADENFKRDDAKSIIDITIQALQVAADNDVLNRSEGSFENIKRSLTKLFGKGVK